MSRRILIIGAGGREHALAWKLAQSPRVARIFVIPGNGGTASLPKVENVLNVSQNDFEQLVAFAIKENIDLVVPGSEVPLVAGITDYFHQNTTRRVQVFGPSKAAARLEGSKVFAKDFMRRHNLPTAAYETFTDYAKAIAFIDAHPDKRWVIKADGLAAGKGVVLPETRENARLALSNMMLMREFGSAGSSVVIEELLEGQELSFLSLCDGSRLCSLPAAQDHKRAYDGDIGPNTGGMGCYAPTPIATAALVERVHHEVLQPTIDGMRKEGFPMTGCLFTGLMITKEGPKVLEYNVRFGDPETQTVLPLLDDDLSDILFDCSQGMLDNGGRKALETKSGSFSTTVVCAAAGYPEKYEKGAAIQLDATETGTTIFHAGTVLDATGKLRTSGGRVIASTAIDSSIKSSVSKAYRGVECIHFDGMHFRKDIAHHALSYQISSRAEPLTYASAGVSIDSGNELVQKIKSLVKSTARPGADAEIGGFGGTFDLSKIDGFPADSPTLVMGIDGIGTKVEIARAVNDYSTIGIDLVAMNVNDIIVQGAEPLTFVDYYSTGHLVTQNAYQFVKGVVEGCKQAGCALVGGETAEMPSVYVGDRMDAAGCATGALRAGQRALPLTEAMAPGNVLLGIASSGPHSNGYSLVRKIVERSGLGYEDPAPWDCSRTLGQALLTPTKIYIRPLLKVLRASPGARILGMAHITGGGLYENVPRMLPNGLAASLDAKKWPVPESLRWLKVSGNLEDKEFGRTLNTGLGMVLVVHEEHAARVQAELADVGEEVYDVGKLIERTAGMAGCVVENLDAWA